MTIHRRPLGAGRRLAALGAIVIIIACFLPWWQTSTDLGLPARTGNAFDGSGVLVFFVALAIIALLALPYAAGDVPVALDRPLSFALLARPFSLSADTGCGWRPWAWPCSAGLPTT